MNTIPQYQFALFCLSFIICEYLNFSHSLSVMNNALTNIFAQMHFFLLLAINWVLRPYASLCWTVWGTGKWQLSVAVLLFVPNRHVTEFWPVCILSDTGCPFATVTFCCGFRLYFSDGLIFICWLAISLSSLESNPIRSLAPFLKAGLFTILLLRCQSSLYSVRTGSLYDTQCAKIFLHSMGSVLLPSWQCLWKHKN